MAKLYNLARMSTATRGAGTITLGSAVLSFLSFSGAGVSDGETVTYAIEDGSNREIGRGVYTASGTTLTRSVLKSTNSDSPIVLSGDAEVFITAAAEDLLVLADGKIVVTVNGEGPHIEALRDGGSVQPDISSTNYSADFAGGPFHSRKARGSRASPLPMLAGDHFGGWGGRGYHSGGSFHASSPTAIHIVASEDQTGSAYGSYLRFVTTPQGSTTRQERAIITDNGTVWAHDTGAYDPKDATQTRPYSDTAILASGSAEGISTGVSFGVFHYGGGTAGYRGGVSGVGGTPAAPAATNAGRMLCFMGGHGHDGSSWTAGSKALIGFRAAEAWTPTAQGTYITIETTPIGSTTRAERARIDPAGNVIVGTAAIATTATDGFLYVPTCAGTPTGVPTTYTGRAPIVIDSTNNKLYFYSGGAWRDAGP